MVQSCPAQIGDPVDEIETPALLVDLDAYERNLDAMAEKIASKGVRLRPHGKTHKSPEIALDQMKRGAVGICCQKVSEAEVMVDGGVTDVLVSNEVIGRKKIARLAALARRADIGVCVDDPGNVAELSAAARDMDVELSVLVEIDVGAGRCGVPPGEPALELAKAVIEAGNLTFNGLQAYHGGAQHIRDFEEKRQAVSDAARLTTETIQLLGEAGIPCPVIAGGGTGSLEIDLELGVLNELQAGSYVFMDADYGRNLDSNGTPFRAYENSLFVRSTVMSTPRRGVAVIDAGLKAVAFDSGNPEIFGRCGATYLEPSDEHGNLEVADNNPLLLGETVSLIPGHCDPTVNLYDWYVGVRGDVVEKVWPVAARGALS